MHRHLAVLRARPYAFVLVLVVALVIANAVVRPSFLAPAQWPALLGTLAPFAILGMASTPPVLGGGGVDLSVGPLATLVNCVLVSVLLPHGLGGPLVSIPLLLLLGVGVGAVNGVLVAIVRLDPVITTLGSLFVLTGAALKIAATPRDTGRSWTTDLAGLMGGWFPGALLTMAAPAVLWLGLRRTAFVRNLYAVGGDDAASFSAGVNVTAVRIGTYAIAGLFASIGGIALTALIQSSDSSLGTTYALVALAAVSLGGTSLAGGTGGVLGSFLGACGIFLLQELLSATGASSNYVQLAYGVLLVLGVILGATLARGKKKEVLA
ncbi:ABC transporter permease [Streptomyces sp. NPDC005799]|uniref:ABC transporter permease n=1 Tax=Streptomyces sp. NPDC005799 TaxID=3154678 RepID=UPI003404E8C3